MPLTANKARVLVSRCLAIRASKYFADQWIWCSLEAKVAGFVTLEPVMKLDEKGFNHAECDVTTAVEERGGVIEHQDKSRGSMGQAN
jgi:hypothetical protein